MAALREKGAVTSFVDVDGGTKAPPATIPEPEPEPICSLEEEMLTLRTRLKQARDEIRASTAEALGCKNDLKVVRHKNKYNRLTRKSSLEALNNNGGRWTNRPAAVTNITGQHRHVSSSSTDSYDDDDDDGDGDGDGDGYYYDDDDSQSDGELERHFQEQLFGRNVGGNVGGSVLSLPSGTTSASRSGAGSRRGSVDNAWASTSKKSVAGRRRRRHNVESGGRNVDGSSGGVGGHLHLRNMSSSTAEEDAAGEHIFDGSTISLLTVGLFCYIFNDIASHCRVISCYIYSSYMCMSVRGGERARKF